jgi:hypothetical protein
MKQENQLSAFELNLKNQPPVPLWMFVVAYVIPWALLAAIALFWPADHAFLGLDFTQSSLARMVPSISAYIDKSPFPHATAAYFVCSSVLWLPFFVLAIRYPLFFAGSAHTRIVFYRKYKKNRIKGWLLVMVGIPILSWGCWFQPGYQYGILPINDSRWALALGGFFFSFYFFIYLTIVGMKNRFYFERLLISERGG